MDDDPLLWSLANLVKVAEANAPITGNGSIMGGIILQVILIAFNAVFACAEIAIISINDNKLAKLTSTGDRRAIRLSRLVEQPGKFLATIQVGITAVNLLGSAFAAENFAGKLSEFAVSLGLNAPVSVIHTFSLVIVTIILLYFTVVFGELVPKRIAMRNADKLALIMSGLVSFISKIFTPIVWFLTVSTNGILRLIGIDPHDIEDEVTEEEIRMMVDVGTEKGAINLDEKEMIQNVFEFDDINAGEVMTHRTEVSLLWLEESDEQWEDTIIESRHSMYPVCDESVDNIVGILVSKDFFRLKNKNRENVLNHAVKPAYFVPETVRADFLFRNMKKNRNHFAVVMDDFGGMSGIVTMYDLLEQLVGDLEDDENVPVDEPFIERIDSHTWKILGSTPTDLIVSQLGVTLPQDYETLGGLVFGLIGTIPEDGSTPEVEGYGLSIKVVEIKEHRLEKAIVCINSTSEEKNTKEVK